MGILRGAQQFRNAPRKILGRLKYADLRDDAFRFAACIRVN